MKNLRKLVTAVLLTSLLCLSAFAGATITSACGPPEPGQVDTPPCAASQAPIPGDMGTPTALATAPGDIDTPAVANDQASLTEIAVAVLRSMLSLF